MNDIAGISSFLLFIPEDNQISFPASLNPPNQLNSKLIIHRIRVRLISKSNRFGFNTHENIDLSKVIFVKAIKVSFVIQDDENVISPFSSTIVRLPLQYDEFQEVR